MKCKIKTMRNWLCYGLKNSYAVQRLFVIASLFLQQHRCAGFQYALPEHYGTAATGYFHEELSLHWDDLELQHLSKVNGPNLHANGFHVINATFPAKQRSYIIHLSKTQGLFHPEHLGLTTGEASHLDCLYSGTATEITRDVSNPASGIVSLSTCHHEFGFEGLLLLSSEQYYIRPDLEHYKLKHRHNPQNHFSRFVKRSADTSSTKPTVLHKAHQVNSKNSPYNKAQGRVDDVLRVPADEYRKVSENQTRNQDLLEDEDPPEEDHDENPVDLESTFMNDVGDGDSMPPVMAALNAKKRKHKTALKKPVKKASTASGKTQVVEIAVFTDEKLYKVWKGLYPKDTTSKMNQYVLAVINNMNALYKQPSFTDSLTFRLVHLDVETSRPKLLKDYSGHATKYLKSFCSYAAEKNTEGRLWDHALMLTGHDLNEGASNNATAGIAWFATMCINGLSCSLIEGMTFGSTFITTHEIGHSLGMEHDGTGQNRGCDADSYIMSPTTGGGKTDWSKCSMKNMKDFISNGYLSNPAPNCITKKGKKADSAIKFKSNKLPGEQFPTEEQCAADCKGCTPHVTSSKPYNNICHALYCAEKKGFYSILRSTHPALEGSNCGKGRKCRLGKCQ